MKTKLSAFALISILFLGSGVSASAGDDFRLVKPLLTRTAIPADVGEFKLDMMVHSWENDDTDVNQWTLSLNFEFGLTNRLGAQIEVPYVFRSVGEQDRDESLGDVEVGLIYRLFGKGNKSLTVATGLDFYFPTGSEGDISRDETREEIFLALSKGFGPLMIDSSVSYELWHDGTHEEDIIGYGLSLALRFYEDYYLIVEGNGTSNLDTDREEIYVTPGIIYAMFDNIALGVGVPIGLTDDANDLGLIVRLTYWF